MLKNPNIILLDEPTSALDSMNEELVSQALHNLFYNKTVLIIAHRLQTVKQADRILYIGRRTIPLDKEGIEGDLPTNTSIILEQ
jgi:ABC-type multidrug transport system fused ATPase/permease subunit